MLEALEAAAVRREERWTTDREIAAMTLELTHAGILQAAAVAGAKNVGKPLRFPRPYDTAPEVQTMSVSAFAAEMRSE